MWPLQVAPFHYTWFTANHFPSTKLHTEHVINLRSAFMMCLWHWLYSCNNYFNSALSLIELAWSLSYYTHTLSQTGSNVSQIACKISTLAMVPSLLEVPATLWHPHCHEAAPSLAVLGMTTTAPSMVQRVPRLAILTTHYLQRWATFGTIWFYHFVYVSTSCCNDTYYICHHIHTYLLTYVIIPCKYQVLIKQVAMGDSNTTCCMHTWVPVWKSTLSPPETMNVFPVLLSLLMAISPQEVMSSEDSVYCSELSRMKGYSELSRIKG